MHKYISRFHLDSFMFWIDLLAKNPQNFQNVVYERNTMVLANQVELSPDLR